MEFSRGLTALRAGDQSTALSGFLMALAIDPETPAHRHKALELLGLTSNYTALPQAVLAGLTRCIQDPEIDLQPLALVVRTLLQHNPMRDQWLVLTDKGGDTLELALDNGSLDGLLTDVLIRAVLNHAINISLDLEVSSRDCGATVCDARSKNQPPFCWGATAVFLKPWPFKPNEPILPGL